MGKSKKLYEGVERNGKIIQLKWWIFQKATSDFSSASIEHFAASIKFYATTSHHILWKIDGVVTSNHDSQKRQIIL